MLWFEMYINGEAPLPFKVKMDGQGDTGSEQASDQWNNETVSRDAGMHLNTAA
jgi:hypothetical protein